MHIVWLASVWVICKENSRFFQQQEETMAKLIDKVKLLSFWWMKAKNPAFIWDINKWWTNPLLYMG